MEPKRCLTLDVRTSSLSLYRVISPRFVRPREVQLECAKTYRHKGLKQTYAKNPRGDS